MSTKARHENSNEGLVPVKVLLSNIRGFSHKGSESDSRFIRRMFHF